MSYNNLPENMRARIEASRANFGRAGISVTIEDAPTGDGITVRLRQDPNRPRLLSESELRDRAARIVEGLPLAVTIEVEAGKKFTVQQDPDTGDLLFRRLIHPEYDARIVKGERFHTFELNGATYSLEPLAGAEDKNLASVTNKARSIIIQDGLFQKLPA